MESRAPDYFTPLLGFREWWIINRKLVAPWMERTWEPGINEARCVPYLERAPQAALLHKDGALAPHPECRCGLYAYPSPKSLGDAHHRAGSGNYPVSGAVAMWGRVEVHQSYGMRSQFALPLNLQLDPEYPEKHQHLIKELVERYKLPLVEPRNFKRESEELLRTKFPLPTTEPHKV